MSSGTPSYAADPVTSVNGKTGDVTLAAADVGALPGAQVESAVIFAAPGRFDGIFPDGSASSSIGLTRAINATPAGGTLIVPPGQYSLDTRLEIRKDMTLVLEGAEFTLVAAPNGTPPTGFLDVRGAYEDVYPVQSLTQGTQTVDNRTLRTYQIELSSSPPWARGDVIKLIADDPIEGARPGSGGLASRVGQYLVVRSVSGGTVIVDGEDLTDPFTNNLRVSRLRKQSFRLRGGKVSTAASGIDSWSNSTLYLQDLYAPIIDNLQIGAAPSQMIQLLGCYGYTLRDCFLGYAPNDPSASRFGYGVLDNCCAYGTIRGLIAHNVRHAYTDDTPRLSAGDGTVGAYGRTFKTKIVDSHGHGTSGITWDTHSASQGIEFRSCTAVGSAPAGFGLRGRQHIVTGCEALGTDEGLLVYTEDSNTDSWGHIISDLTIRDARKNAINATLNASESRPTIITGLVAENCARVLYCKNVNLILNDLAYIAPATVANGNAVVTANAAVISGQSWTFDYSSNSNGTGLLSVSTSAASVTRIQGCAVRYGSTANAQRHQYFARGANNTAFSRFVLTGLTFDFAPGTSPYGPIANCTSIDPASILDWIAYEGAVATSAAAYLWNTSTTTAEPHGANYISQAIPRAASSSVLLFFNVEYHSNLFIMKDGRLPGQQLLLINQSAVKNLTIRSGDAAYNVTTLSGSNVVLTPGQQFRLAWNGTTWLEVS
ncbi:hypothetical protein [Microbacterium sp. RURRCA19A]|uniref:hypothetical protein n=1 Tax=Microbacterium sp. RURRCA19A TaxID=1907391 RepID=UPI000954D809|nr:hypothetical protein [Microbacterium sp. RURRCA19A]SIR78535.1 hypothetical protein SAMN05880568_1458 [Microbacterium sp. RURRCA19A]